MTEEKKIDLMAEGLLAEAAPEAKKEVPDEDLTEFITRTMLSLQDSLGSMQIGIRIMSQRVATLEKYVAYLLEVDPKMGPKIQEQLEKAQAMETAQAAAQAASPAAE